MCGGLGSHNTGTSLRECKPWRGFTILRVTQELALTAVQLAPSEICSMSEWKDPIGWDISDDSARNFDARKLVNTPDRPSKKYTRLTQNLKVIIANFEQNIDQSERRSQSENCRF